MSFMFKPLAYDEPNAVNRIELNEDITASLIEGNVNVVYTLLQTFKNTDVKHATLCVDGYVGALFDLFIDEVKKQNMELGIKIDYINMKNIYKGEAEITELTKESLPLNYDEDPVLLFGRLYEGNTIDFMDENKLQELLETIDKQVNGLTIVYGMGSSIKEIRAHADKVAYIDVTPKVAAIRAREERYVNIGDEQARPFNLLMRRNYFVDFETTIRLRKELLTQDAIDYYILGSDEENLKMMSYRAVDALMTTLVQYPFRAKPVYLEGIWGGEYIRKLRNIPMDISSNIAWIFEFIPMEVSIEVAVNDTTVDIPFSTFVQMKGKEMMGEHAYEEFEGYFPIRFNYDDTWHSDGNMSIQVHPDEDYVLENYNEFGRQDEAYYVIATGHDAKTFVGWNGDGKEFIELAKKSEVDHEMIDYESYINAVPSIPGRQIMLPAGTIHSSGRNQLILELGSLTIGSYTYKVYDYNRKDKEGNVRPIHTANAQAVLHYERDSEWVNENIAIEPKLVKETRDYKEYVVGLTDLMYYATNRIEMNTNGTYEGINDGQFTVLTLVDGEEVHISSKEHPEFNFTQHYLEVVTIPATIHDYVIEAKGYQPVVVHKTYLRDGYTRYKNQKYKER